MWWLLIHMVSARIDSYTSGKEQLWIVRPGEVPESEFDAVFTSEAVRVQTWNEDAPRLRLPICTLDESNRCECRVAFSDHSFKNCHVGDGKRDLDGNCHVSMSSYCEVHSDLRTKFNDYEWKGHHVFLHYPYGITFDDFKKREMVVDKVVYQRYCTGIEGDLCKCEIRNVVTSETTNCVSHSHVGLVPIDPAINRCHLAVKTFDDGSFACFPIEDPRPSKIDLDRLKSGLPNDYVGEITMSYVEPKPDGIVMGFQSRPGIIISPMVYSILEPLVVEGSTVEFRVPLSPFGKEFKHKLKLPNGLETLASCTLKGVTLHAFINSRHECTLLDSEKAMYFTNACRLSIHMSRLGTFYKQIRTNSAPIQDDGICHSMAFF